MNKNDMIIYQFHQLDIYDLTEEQQQELVTNIVSNVNINNLEEKIHDCILKLSGVGGPSFGADAKYIALDNQKRLEIIHQLLYYLDIFKTDTKYIKKQLKKENNYLDYERLLNYLTFTKNLINSIWDYGEYREFDKQEQIRQLNEWKLIRNLQLEQEKQEGLWTKEDTKRLEDDLDGLKDTLQDTIKILKEDKENE